MIMDSRNRFDEIHQLIEDHLNGLCRCRSVYHDYANVAKYVYITFMTDGSYLVKHDQAFQVLKGEALKGLLDSFNLIETKAIDPSHPEHSTFYIAKPTISSLKRFRPARSFIDSLKTV